MTTSSPAVWILFNLFVLLMIALDALVLSPKDKEININLSEKTKGLYFVRLSGKQTFQVTKITIR